MLFESAILAGLGMGLKRAGKNEVLTDLTKIFNETFDKSVALPGWINKMVTPVGSTVFRAGAGGLAGYGIGSGIDYLRGGYDHAWRNRLGKWGMLAGAGSGIYSNFDVIREALPEKYNSALTKAINTIKGAHKKTTVAGNPSGIHPNW